MAAKRCFRVRSLPRLHRGPTERQHASARRELCLLISLKEYSSGFEPLSCARQNSGYVPLFQTRKAATEQVLGLNTYKTRRKASKAVVFAPASVTTVSRTAMRPTSMTWMTPGLPTAT